MNINNDQSFGTMATLVGFQFSPVVLLRTALVYAKGANIMMPVFRTIINSVSDQYDHPVMY